MFSEKRAHLVTTEWFSTNFSDILGKATNCALNNQFHSNGSVSGGFVLEGATVLQNSVPFKDFAQNQMFSIFNEVQHEHTFCEMREKAFSLFHTKVIPELSEFHPNSPLHSIDCDVPLMWLRITGIEILTATVQGVFDKIVTELESGKERAGATVHERNSIASSSEVLYFIAGYVIKALKRLCRRYMNSTKYQSMYKGIRDVLEVNEKQSTDNHRFSGWTKKVDRGGLSYPAPDFVDFITCCETAVSYELPNGLQSFNYEQIVAELLADHSVMLWWDKLFHKDNSSSQLLLERILRLFVTVRAHAVARLIKRRHERHEKISLKCAKGLRKTLKDLAPYKGHIIS